MRAGIVHAAMAACVYLEYVARGNVVVAKRAHERQNPAVAGQVDVRFIVACPDNRSVTIMYRPPLSLLTLLMVNV